MNYRHAYHAGNFADVLKHLVLARVITHLKKKPAPFRVIDTHAGTGLYDLTGPEALKTGEWKDGIGRLLDPPLPADVAEICQPYLDAVFAANPAGDLKTYPGSPMIARHLLRAGDVLAVNELHPEDHATLARLFARDRQVKVLNIDGWAALKALLPPKERRGVVLVDPPFEEAGELQRLVTGLQDALNRFATGTVILWYPIKARRPVEAFHRAVQDLHLSKMLTVELFIQTNDETVLNGTGLVVLNPPFTLAAELERVLPELTRRLGVASDAHYRLRGSVD